MLDPDFDPYDILANHSQAISNLINAVKENSQNQVRLAEAHKEMNHSLIRIYTEMKNLDHRIRRLERGQDAFKQTTADDRPQR